MVKRDDVVIILDNIDTREFFFTTDHCQPVDNKNYVPVTFYLPYHIVPREHFETGILNTQKDIKRFLEHCGSKEIANPNKEYQA